MDSRIPVGANLALLLYSSGINSGTCPAQFLEIGRSGAAVVTSAAPSVGQSVSVCQVEPQHTTWMQAKVVEIDRAVDMPFRLTLAFDPPISDDTVAIIVQGSSDR